MSVTAIGVGLAALAVIGGGLGIGVATSSAVKAIAQQPISRRKNYAYFTFRSCLSRSNCYLWFRFRYFNYFDA